MNKEKFNPNDFFMEKILNDEFMVVLESAPPVDHPGKLVLSFLNPDDGWGKTLLNEFYLDKESLFKLSDLLMEFRKKIEAEEKFLETERKEKEHE